MADVFERRADLNAERDRLWELIDNTPNLDWLLLTKRPQNICVVLHLGEMIGLTTFGWEQVSN